MQIQLQRAVAAPDRRAEPLLHRPVQAMAGAQGGDAALTATLNRSAAVQAQFALQRVLNGRPALAAQAGLAQSLSGRTIQRDAKPPGDDVLKLGATAPAALLPDKSQCAICADADSEKKAKKKSPMQRVANPAVPVAQLSAAGGVAQLIYLWDRNTADRPTWSDEAPPEGYLISGRYKDEEHEEDDLYARLAGQDLFYGISYEEGGEAEEFLTALQKYAEDNELPMETGTEQKEAVRSFIRSGGTPLLDVETMKTLYSGSSGWDQYSAYLEEDSSEAAFAAKARELNPDLPWASSDDPAAFACQVAMIGALADGGSVRFLLDGLDNVEGILDGTAYQDKVTSHELKFAVGLLGKTVAVSDEQEVTPKDGENVFFYLNRKLVPADQIGS